jgi:hypothetical protein
MLFSSAILEGVENFESEETRGGVVYDVLGLEDEEVMSDSVRDLMTGWAAEARPFLARVPSSLGVQKPTAGVV